MLSRVVSMSTETNISKKNMNVKMYTHGSVLYTNIYKYKHKYKYIYIYIVDTLKQKDTKETFSTSKCQE